MHILQHRLGLCSAAEGSIGSGGRLPASGVSLASPSTSHDENFLGEAFLRLEPTGE